MTLPLDDVTAALVARFGSTTPTLSPRAALGAMIAFYVEHRVQGCDLDDDGDMLLVQWHKAHPLDDTDDVDGVIEFDVVRQLIVAGQDVEPLQLHLRGRFAFIDADDFIDDHVWCETPDDVEDLIDAIGEALGELKHDNGALLLDRPQPFAIELEQV